MTLHPDVERIALLGWKLVPATQSKKGCFKGERYGLSSFIQAATDDLDTLEGWSREFPHCCWKVRPNGSGVWFLDVDVPGETHSKDGVASLRALTELHGPLPPRPHGRSPSGGHVLVFRDTGVPLDRGSNKPAPGLDTLHMDLCATVAPSKRRSGAYRWVVPPWEIAAPPAPDWLLALLKPPAPPAHRPPRPMAPTDDRAIRALMRSFSVVAAAPHGERNFALLRRATLIGGYVAAGVIGRQQAECELIAAGTEAGQSHAEATSTVRSGLRRGEAKPVEWGSA